jgi:5-(carboxyamino)imidazole ribonucleotide synthase
MKELSEKSNLFLKVGILGGGQLGLMISQASISYGLGLYILDPDPQASARSFCSEFSQGSFSEEETVYHFGKNLDIITIEIEHVNIQALYRLEKIGVKVYPQPHIIELIQDKGLQKQFLLDQGFPTAPYYNLDSTKSLMEHAPYFPAMLKSRKGGYDGKGVKAIRSLRDAEWIIEGNFPDGPSILEQWADMEMEISVLVARNSRGEVEVYDPVQMEFNPEANLVEYLFSPAHISIDIASKAQSLARNIIEKLGMVGLLAVEMFVLKNGEIWVNEMAPRPHNSGHHTIEACYTSQFDQLIRAILDLPLGDTGIRSPSVMVNVLGEPGYSGSVDFIGLDGVLQKKGVYLHLYGKRETRPMRKMGHITILDKDWEKAYRLAKEVKNLFKIISTKKQAK